MVLEQHIVYHALHAIIIRGPCCHLPLSSCRHHLKDDLRPNARNFVPRVRYTPPSGHFKTVYEMAKQQEQERKMREGEIEIA